jgi:putative flippase GtrA
MTPARLVFLYVSFAVFATLVNILTQHTSLLVYRGDHALWVAMVGGTMTGLVTKYLLDKNWIFSDLSSGAIEHARKFSLYTLMGVLTTLIFWGSEVAFHEMFRTPFWRDVGAVLGLAVGYCIKYRLDRQFVFPRDATS